MDLLSYAIILGKRYLYSSRQKKLNHLIAETCKRFPENKYEIEKCIAFKFNIIAAFYNNSFGFSVSILIFCQWIMFIFRPQHDHQ